MSDFVSLLANVYDTLAATDPAARLAPRGEAQKVLFVSLAHRFRDLARALDCVEHVEALVAVLPPRADREAVFRALSAGAMLAAQVEDLAPEWLRDRDDALKGAVEAVRRVRRILERRDLGDNLAHVEVGLSRLTGLGGSLSDRAELAPSAGGRPRALWREHVADRLRRAGVAAEAAADLLQAAGLADASPRRAASRARPRRKSKRRRR